MPFLCRNRPMVTRYQFNLCGHLVSTVVTPSSSVNGLDCFENLREFDYLTEKKSISKSFKRIQCFVFRNLPLRLAWTDKVVSAQLSIDCAI